jgi:hypothetical protein
MAINNLPDECLNESELDLTTKNSSSTPKASYGAKFHVRKSSLYDQSSAGRNKSEDQNSSVRNSNEHAEDTFFDMAKARKFS